MDKAQLGLVSKKRTRPCFNCLSQSLDTHRQMDAHSNSDHTYAYTHVPAHTPTQRSSTFAGPINTAPPQWTSGGNLQGPQHFYYNPRPTACVQPAQMWANHQSLLNSTMRATRTHDAQTPAGPLCSGSEFGTQSTPPMSPGHVPLRQTPPRVTEPLHTGSVSSPDEPRSITCGCTPLSSVFPLVLPEPANLCLGDDPIGWPPGLLASDYMLNFPPMNDPIAWDGVICMTESCSHARGEDASFGSYHLEEPISTPQYSELLSSIVIPGDHLLPSVPLWSTSAGFSPVEDPSSHSPRPILQANLTASGHTPNSGGGRNGSDVNFNVDAAHTNENSTTFKSNHHTGPDRSGRTHTRRESKPYQRPTPSVTPKIRPVKYEDNLERLQKRCKEQGADEGAIGLLGKVFANEVSHAALTRSLTDEEVETKELGIVTGKVYTAFLEPTDEGRGDAPRYICRLCHSDQTWKHAKDVVRHLKRDHFGFADTCKKWYVFYHLLTFASADIVLPGHAAGKSPIQKARGHDIAASSA